MKNIFLLLLTVLCLSTASEAISQNSDREFFELRLFHIEDKEQEKRMDQYLKNAFLPALERSGVERAGVFKPIESDSAYGEAIYLFIPYKSMDQFVDVSRDLESDSGYLSDAQDYINSSHDNPPYIRMETMLLDAFEGMPQHSQAKLNTPASERVYELRSYESATEKLYKKKVEMFNEGETEIFERLNFNPIFYGEVIAGCKMPNLMYMTSHANLKEREKNWDNFIKDEAWEKMSGMEEYQNTVSHIDIILLHPTEYSKL